MPQPIEDHQTTVSRIEVDSQLEIGDLRVRVDISHTYRDDLELSLTSPSGTTVVLKSGPVSDSGDNIVGTYGADLESEESLQAFEGEFTTGTWTLEIHDHWSGDNGTLNFWGIEFCEALPCVVGQATDVPQEGYNPGIQESTIVLPAGPPIDSLRVGVSVTVLHPDGLGGFFTFELISPSGTRITLHDTVVFGTLAGTYGVDLEPLEPLEAFNGELPEGPWRFVVSPNHPEITELGTRINDWNIEVCGTETVEKCRTVSVCDDGYVRGGVNGCVDFDECAPLFNACPVGHQCNNLPGSFECICDDPDGDTFCNSVDNCPLVANPDQADNDADMLGDPCDPDDDNDGVDDSTDACPTGMSSGPDTDADGCKDDGEDSDDDNDGVDDTADNCPTSANPSQLDDDNDGIGNACDVCPLDVDPGQEDADNDGVGNACDICSLDSDPGQEDTDGDGFGDACDNCPLDPDPTQPDIDADGFGDACDNCIFVRNESQSDLDDDGEGNACDVNDGVGFVFFSEPDLVEWTDEVNALSYNVYSGALDVLLSGGEYTQDPGSHAAAERTCGWTDLFLPAGYVPAPGEAVFYLTTIVDPAGEGSLWEGEGPDDRTNTRPCD